MEDLKNILPTGKLNAISARDLAVKLGVSDRVLRDIVTAERVKGVVICSSSAGYYLPDNRDEIREFCNFMEKRAKRSSSIGRSRGTAGIYTLKPGSERRRRQAHNEGRLWKSGQSHY